MKMFFHELPAKLDSLIFQKEISASSLFDFDNRITDNYNISIQYAEKLHSFYIEVLTKYPDFINQFYIAISNILNQCYELPISSIDDDLPF